MLRLLSAFCCLAVLLAATPAVRADGLSAYGEQSEGDAAARKAAREHAAYLSDANEYSLKYMQEAREYRSLGRYELARQRYLQALSICADDATAQILRRELDGVDLLLRTMR
ncbi:tetratricopeptide repeat protein [Desulfovibrio legallii]|uniref:TPR repeat-containing protein n=1 Tax=Desulfovibrio legallii TaxID=571438 RepID=A0A1G7I4N5_9BACT|nr:tetratricopeptide repeat protein [Desulfovibrio legallii]SDF07568.1 TPR repeat-containing protein [Desulfovibrio legallii]